MRLAIFTLIGAIGALTAAAPAGAAPISPGLDLKQPSSITQVNYYGRRDGWRHHGYYGHRGYYGYYGRGYYPYSGGGYYRYHNWYGYQRNSATARNPGCWPGFFYPSGASEWPGICPARN
jgi:hypothetical protein